MKTHTNLIDKLKALTKNQILDIASLAVKDVDWVITNPRSKWDGFDLVEAESKDNPTEAKNVFQIDYREDTKGKDRFRHYINLEEWSVGYNTKNDIIDYLDTI